MKKLLVIHNSSWNDLVIVSKRVNNDVAGWNMIIEDWEEMTYIRKWTEVTPEECEGYKYVMLILLPEQDLDKMDKYQAIISRPSRQYKVLIYIADVVGWQMHPFLPENKRRYMDIVSGADYVLRYNLPINETYWQAVMKDKPSYFIERAYPIEIAKGILQEDLPKAVKVMDDYGLERGEKFIFVGKSLKNINEERNTLLSLYVAQKIQELTDWRVICFANNPLDTDEKDGLYKDVCRLDNVIELPVLPWKDYIRILSELNVQVGIYLDCLETRGQVALDCACAQIPLVCSGSVAGYKLYPYTWLPQCRNLEYAVMLGKSIVEDKNFTSKVITTATKNVQEYSKEVTRKKLEAIIGEEL